jgi:hypothetical protein
MISVDAPRQSRSCGPFQLSEVVYQFQSSAPVETECGNLLLDQSTRLPGISRGFQETSAMNASQPCEKNLGESYFYHFSCLNVRNLTQGSTQKGRALAFYQ